MHEGIDGQGVNDKNCCLCYHLAAFNDDCTWASQLDAGILSSQFLVPCQDSGSMFFGIEFLAQEPYILLNSWHRSPIFY